MKRILVLLLAMASVGSSGLLSGCIGIPKVVKDERSLSAQYSDASIKTSIASAMLKESPSKANDVNVHCFRGHVFIVGEADAAFRRFSLKTAQGTNGVVHVTTHWFATGTGSTVSDTGLETRIDTALLFTKDIPSSQVVVDVWGANVVLSGIMGEQGDIDRTVAAVRKVSGVKSVTSYISL